MPLQFSWLIECTFNGGKGQNLTNDQMITYDRKGKDKHFWAWINEPEIVHSSVEGLVKNSLRRKRRENLGLVINEPALVLASHGWLVMKVLQLQKRKPYQFGINDWQSQKHSWAALRL